MRVLRQLCDRAFSAWKRLVAAVAQQDIETCVESVGDFDFWP